MIKIFHIEVVLKIITSLAKEVMFLVALVCLFVCLFVGGQHYSKSYERIGMKILWRDPGWYSEKLIKVWWCSTYS